MQQNSNQSEQSRTRAITLYILEVREVNSEEVIGQGYVMCDGFIHTKPLLSDMKGNPLPERMFQLNVVEEYCCVINDRIH